MDHCFYIAKRTVKPACRNHSPGGFWVLLNAQKYQGKMYFWPILVTLPLLREISLKLFTTMFIIELRLVRNKHLTLAADRKTRIPSFWDQFLLSVRLKGHLLQGHHTRDRSLHLF